ncbi:MAG TPA: hypothetical protein VKZ63_16055 [Kofleriaceae bacterium]|nr:hypothetical protein [Kofleriaceae bacterium]
MIALRVALLLAALPLSGCFAQASVGAQRSPDGAWGASGGLAAGLHFDITDAVAAGVGVEGSLVPYRNDQGHGLAVSGPVTGYAHVALARSERHVLAVRGEASVPPGRVSLTPDRTGTDGEVAGVRAVRGFLGLSHRLVRDHGEEGVASLYTAAGAQAVALYGPGFDDVTTIGPSFTIGYTLSGHMVLTMIECFFEDDDELFSKCD